MLLGHFDFGLVNQLQSLVETELAENIGCGSLGFLNGARETES
jgi:hypothetical protein